MFCFCITLHLGVLSCYANMILPVSFHVKISSELIRSEISKQLDKAWFLSGVNSSEAGELNRDIFLNSNGNDSVSVTRKNEFS